MENFKIEYTEWGNFKNFFKRHAIPSKTILLKEGEISKKAYYIEKGCLRVCFNNNGKDITFQFFFEGEWVSSIERVLSQTNQVYLRLKALSRVLYIPFLKRIFNPYWIHPRKLNSSWKDTLFNV